MRCCFDHPLGGTHHQELCEIEQRQLAGLIIPSSWFDSRFRNHATINRRGRDGSKFLYDTLKLTAGSVRVQDQIITRMKIERTLLRECRGHLKAKKSGVVRSTLGRGLRKFERAEIPQASRIGNPEFRFQSRVNAQSLPSGLTS